jgi:hypothetical protein
MPPVLAPVSPSPTRLCPGRNRSPTTVVPSVSANRLASSPVRNSRSRPPPPRRRSCPRTSRRARQGLVLRLGDHHALARGEPVRLDDHRQREAGERGFRLARLAQRRYAAVGMPARAQRSLVNPFDPSSCAAARLGPNTGTAAARRLSASPSTSGASGRSRRAQSPCPGKTRPPRMIARVERHAQGLRRDARIARVRRRGSPAAAIAPASKRAHVRGLPIPTAGRSWLFPSVQAGS